MRRLLALVLYGTSLFAQQTTETVQVTIVEVPVTVLDRAGKPVEGLTEADFTVTDDGKKTEIAGFERLDLSSTAPASPAAYRKFLLLFDFANSSPGTISRAQTAARQFVKTQLGRRDLAAVATFSADRGVSLITSFTSDRELLAHAVATLGHPGYFRDPDPLRVAMRDVSQAARIEAHGVQGPVDVPLADMGQWTKMSNQVQDQELRGRLRKQFAALGGIARTLDALRGQKQVILLSEGFDPRLVQGSEPGKQSTFYDSTGTNDGSDSDVQFGSAGLIRDLEEMGRAFRRSGVTLHAIDIKGLRSSVDAATGGTRANTGESLHLLTRPTGGTVLKNATDLTASFAELLRQQETVYLLAIRARVEKPGKFHALKVQVPGVRGANVTHRAGYHESQPASSPLEQTLTLAEVMMTDAPVQDVPLSVSTLALPSKRGGARLPVVVELPGEALLRNAKGNKVTANVYIYAFDEQSQVRDFLQQRISLDLARNGEALRGSGLRYAGTLMLPPGRYAVKALARVEETGRIGFLSTDVDVPATSGPAVLPPVFVSERTGGINVAAQAGGAGAVEALTIAGNAFVPQHRATLKPNGTYRVALFLYDTPAEALDITPMIVGADGSSQSAPVSLVGRTSPDEEGAAKLVLDFKPTNLAAGDYRLQFTVKPKGGQASVVEVPFRVTESGQ